MKPYLLDLNEIQRKAVTTTDGPVLVVAGPGSGKTRVLTYRIAHIIQKGTKPWEILALTFTNKAAREMKERIAKVVGDKANQVWAGTFHSIFARILRVEAEKLGYPSNFTIYDSDDSKSLIKNIIKEKNLNPEIYNVNAIRARISSAKSNIIPPKAYRENAELMEQDRFAKRPYTVDIYTAYMARCKKAGAMDFDDLLYQLYALLYKNPDNVLEKYQNRFKYLLVDEFQDTNHLQYQIVLKLTNFKNSMRNVCVVGDDAQSIYGFRGATIENILDFEKDFKQHNIQVFKLEQNYRSTEHIVKAANEVITFNKRQIKKEIWSNKGDGSKIKVIKAQTDNEEGKRIADTIVEQKNRHHLSNKEIAILYRTNAQSRVFEEYLRRYNILYKVYGGLSFYQRKEVKDLVAYFRLVVNPSDEEAFRRVVNYPKRGIGKASVEKLTAVAVQTDQSLWDSVEQVNLGARAKNSLLAFKQIIQSFQSKKDSLNAYELATIIAKKSKILDTLKADNTIEGMGRLENIVGLLDGIKEFVENDEVTEEENEDKSLATYLQNIALHTDLDEKKDIDDFVTLMSVHSAKGLEFKSVFVVGLEEKLFPSFMSLDTIEGIDEERRLFYVAITRAEQFLTLSYANSRYRYGQMRYNEPSRFLNEIDIRHIESNTAMRQSALNSTGISAMPSRSGVKGNFKRVTPNTTLMADPATFKPSPSSQIQAGMKVLHLKFGEGKVLSIDGSEKNKVATIFFNKIDNPQRRIMLKFAKLQILS